MNLYLDAQYGTTDETPIVGCIEAVLKNGKTIDISWNAGDISFESDSFSAKLTSVQFDDDYADNRVEELEGMTVKNVWLRVEHTLLTDFKITKMVFEDWKKAYAHDASGENINVVYD